MGKTTNTKRRFVGESRVAPDDVIKTIGLLEPEAKILSEELANPVGQRIIQILSSNDLTTAELAKKLDISIQLIAYHVKRLSKAGVLGIASWGISQRGKDMKRYTLKKQSFLFVVDSPIEEKEKYRAKLKRTALRKFIERVLFSAVGCVSSSLFSYWLLQLFLKRGISSPSTGPNMWVRPVLPETNPIGPPYILSSLLIGFLVGSIIWYLRIMKTIPVAYDNHKIQSNMPAS